MHLHEGQYGPLLTAVPFRMHLEKVWIDYRQQKATALALPWGQQADCEAWTWDLQDIDKDLGMHASIILELCT